MSAVQHVQELDQSADVFLYILSGYDVNNPNASLRFSSFAGVSFNGPFLPISVSHDTQEISSVGSQPRLSLSVSDTGGVFSAMVNSNEGGIEGSKLRIIRTKTRFLDTGATPSTTEGVLMRSDLVLTNISNWVPGEVLVATFSSVLDYGGGETSCPARVAHQKCSWVYRSGIGCTYTGAAMFGLDNQPVIDSSLDKCNKSIAACKLRFPNSPLPTSAFPTLQRR